MIHLARKLWRWLTGQPPTRLMAVPWQAIQPPHFLADQALLAEAHRRAALGQLRIVHVTGEQMDALIKDLSGFNPSPNQENRGPLLLLKGKEVICPICSRGPMRLKQIGPVDMDHWTHCPNGHEITVREAIDGVPDGEGFSFN